MDKTSPAYHRWVRLKNEETFLLDDISIGGPPHTEELAKLRAEITALEKSDVVSSVPPLSSGVLDKG